MKNPVNVALSQAGVDAYLRAKGYTFEFRWLAQLDGKPLVYFVLDAHGSVKVGFATKVCNRVFVIQNSHAQPIRVYALAEGSREIERRCHQILEPFRIRREWYRFDAEFERKCLGLGLNWVQPPVSVR
jgi:Meiotically up-regulated gene 113